MLILPSNPSVAATARSRTDLSGEPRFERGRRTGITSATSVRLHLNPTQMGPLPPRQWTFRERPFRFQAGTNKTPLGKDGALSDKGRARAGGSSAHHAP